MTGANTPRVSRIVYREHLDDLFDGMTALEGVDLGASGARYLEVLEAQLRDAYPGAEIETQAAHDHVPEWGHVTVWTAPELVWRDDEDEQALAQEVDAERLGEETQEDVKQLAAALWEHMERWMVLEEPLR